jgi:hypothetical protein
MLEVIFEGGRASSLLEGIADRLGSPHAMLDLLVDDVHEYERDVFATNGHGQWPALSPNTDGSGRMLVDQGDLLAALTTNADLMGDSASVNADDVAHARFHGTGTSRMPRRDPAPPPPGSTVTEWAADLLGYVVDGQRR